MYQKRVAGPHILRASNFSLILLPRLTTQPAVACTQTLLYSPFYSFRARGNERGGARLREKEKYIFFFPYHYPVALVVNTSRGLYFITRARRSFKENRGSVNRVNQRNPPETGFEKI